MSDSDVPSSRPAGLITILAIFACFGAFLLVMRIAYRPRAVSEMPFNLAAEKLSKDQEWAATPEARVAYLCQLREKQDKQLASYGWVDRKKGVVQLPIDRAMQLVVQEYSRPAGEDKNSKQ